MARKITAVVVGFIAGNLFNAAFIIASILVFPLPDGVSPFTAPEKFQEHVAENGLPTGALIFVLIAHAGGSFVSGLVCGLVAMRAWYVPALCFGIFFTIGGIYNLTQIPSPTWFAITDIVLYIPAALVGVMIGGALVGNKLAEPATAK